MPRPATQQPPAQDDTQRYDYYFRRQRPGFVARLLARKQRENLRLASGDGVPSTVIELGPGEGWFAQACQQAGVARYVGVEASSAGVAALGSLGVEVVQATLPPLPAGLPQADLVYASHFVEHMAGPDEVRQLLTECRQVLAPGGRLVLAFPDARTLGTDFWDCDYTHRWPSTARRMRQVARDAGFDVVRLHRCCLHLTGLRAHALRLCVRLVPWRMLESLERGDQDFWFRGKMLFAPELLFVLRPTPRLVSADAQDEQPR